MDRRSFLGATGLAYGAMLLRADESPPKQPSVGKSLQSKSLCVAPDQRAAEVGAEILRNGGNAFDAVVAAGFMEAVIAPAGSGIGGYAGTGIGFDASTQQVVAIDANAVAPAAATADMFPVISQADSLDYRFPDDRHRRGPLSVAVTGVLAGLLHILEKWGTLDRRKVMEPAIRQARAGIPLIAGQARAWLEMRAEASGTTHPADEAIPAIVPVSELADSLEAIAEEGADVFYSGRIGRAIVDHLRRRGGILNIDDFARYQPMTVKPVEVNVGRHRLLAPPPSSGGLTSLQMTALFDRALAGAEAPVAGSPEAFELSIEISKVVWAERLTELGDPAAMRVAPQSLLEESHLEALLDKVRAGLKRPTHGRIIAPDPLRGTVHLAAADAQGNVIAWTQTHGAGFGSGVMVPGTGIVLGHGMCRFEPRPGWINSIGPGKRPLHNMCPLLALRDEQPVLAVGAAGGRSIVNNSAALATHRLVLELGAVESASAPRVQCESIEPATVETSAGEDCPKQLIARGHLVKVVPRDAGTAHLIARDRDGWHGVAESRTPLAAVADGARVVISGRTLNQFRF